MAAAEAVGENQLQRIIRDLRGSASLLPPPAPRWVQASHPALFSYSCILYFHKGGSKHPGEFSSFTTFPSARLRDLTFPGSNAPSHHHQGSPFQAARHT
ncbi:hypothetical protein AGIG_G14558 [Arapaima gigas]